jgi:8-oxo-dGTP diphosphatase
MEAGTKRPIVIVAACALLNDAGEVLIAKRPQGRPLAGLWELPGGKIEPGEEPEEALLRELSEELGIDVARADLRPLTFASHAYADFHLLMPVYLCSRWQGRVVPNEGQEIAWVEPGALGNYDMPPADEPLKPVLSEALRAFAGRS